MDCDARLPAMTVDVRRATNRARIEQPGIVTWHSFSAGPHYDPNNISFGALIAHDEHLLAAAAGFPKHAHRGVDIVSWVLDGELRHNGQTIGVGSVLHQRTGDGIEHVEANARSDRSLRFVQMALLSSETYNATVGTAELICLPGGGRVWNWFFGCPTRRSIWLVYRHDCRLACH